MQGMVSDKTFHLKWNNHLQNLSQLFTTIYSSSALADVTLSCRDGTLKAHKLVLSACSPYFEQIFKDNPCQHPIVILKGIPFSEINLLVEFMYKGSVDVQEMDLQSLMHTAAELEIRGLAYEARDNAAQMLNINLEYPTYPQTHVPPLVPQYPQTRTDVERLKQIHLYQQSMMRAEELRRRRRDDPPTTHTAVNNILAAAAREMEEARHMGSVRGTSIQTEHDQAPSATTSTSTEVKREADDDRPKKRPSILSPEDEKMRIKKKMTVRFQDEHTPERERAKLTSPVPDREMKITSVRSLSANDKAEGGVKTGTIKVVPMATLKANNDHDEDSDDKPNRDDDEETDSSGSVSDSAANDSREGRPHVCEFCDQRFQRSSHLSRHRLTHTGERPFTCGGCGRSFARSDKLRVHTKICEKEDPTVDMNTNDTPKRESNSEVMSGMVRTSHRESGHLVFTPSGDVMLPPRTNPVLLNSTLEPLRNELSPGDLVDPPRRGRGRPRKTPLPLTPKIKKRRGRPPKTSLDKLTPQPYLVERTIKQEPELDVVENSIEMQDPEPHLVQWQDPEPYLILRQDPEPHLIERLIKREPDPEPYLVESSIQQEFEPPVKRGRGRPRKKPHPLPCMVKIHAVNIPLIMPEPDQSYLKECSVPLQDHEPRLVVESIKQELIQVKRGRGRPRKIKRQVGRPRKDSYQIIKKEPDMEGCVLTSGAVPPTAPITSLGSPTAAQLLLKRRRGRPPKNYGVGMTRPGMDMLTAPYGLPDFDKYGRPNENYNATNLPFGDFAYLTEMMYNPLSFSYNVTNADPESGSLDQSGATESSHDRTIDVSDSSTEEDETSRVEPEENVPPVAMETQVMSTQVMTVGDCQIVKLPPNADENDVDTVKDNSQVATTTTSSAVTITPINTVGDCTIRPVDNNT